MTVFRENPFSKPFLKRVFFATERRVSHPATLTIMIGATIICTLIGPFDTYRQDSFAFRLYFWGAIVLTSTTYGCLASVWTNLAFRHLPYWQRTLINLPIFALPFTLVSWEFASMFYAPQDMPHPIVVLSLILAVDLFVHGCLWVSYANRKKAVPPQEQPLRMPAPPPPLPDTPPSETVLPETEPEPEAKPEGCPFLHRLGPNGGSYLIRLAMNDHYIEAHTDTGIHMLYMRFGDAVAMLNSENGAKVHRSHWVRFSEIIDVERNGQKVALVMSDGATVPVSRSHKAFLQEKGII
ncbi:LytTR family DNA-binding domain-containing protein [Neptunicoccus sediminis]|uniref:LytTR family DNA-binding domain-containing protein n=1 Tax=Neptunicoccus sediminis TaxID=1892596 RepID=UPI0008461DB9|nr:LytTR family DNA-binding domain-containing protein [Neptunicoccus sediminis]